MEDEPQILNLVHRILKQHGYNVLAAATPHSALDLAERYSGVIHLLITDVVMPGMNGKALLDEMQRRYPSLKYLFISGYNADVIAHQGVLPEGVEFLQKPFDIGAIAEKVRKVLEAPRRA